MCFLSSMETALTFIEKVAHSVSVYYDDPKLHLKKHITGKEDSSTRVNKAPPDLTNIQRRLYQKFPGFIKWSDTWHRNPSILRVGRSSPSLTESNFKNFPSTLFATSIRPYLQRNALLTLTIITPYTILTIHLAFTFAAFGG